MSQPPEPDELEKFFAQQEALYTKVPPVVMSAITPESDLRGMLREYAAWLVWLDAEVGRQAGRCLIFKERYRLELSLARAQWAQVPSSKMAEAAKEDAALAGSPELQELRWRWAREEGLYITGKGILDSYQTAYNEVSRQIAYREMEASVATSKFS